MFPQCRSCVLWNDVCYLATAAVREDFASLDSFALSLQLFSVANVVFQDLAKPDSMQLPHCDLVGL